MALPLQRYLGIGSFLAARPLAQTMLWSPVESQTANARSTVVGMLDTSGPIAAITGAAFLGVLRWPHRQPLTRFCGRDPSQGSIS
ncbi:MAG: hypothetical protein L0Z53_00355 [Acidobacteriales bacterium]|nr:hypothetical protein [Terriglobales bacterium]